MEGPGLGLSAIGLIFCLILVLGNAYFVATEFALVAVRRSQIKLWVREGRRGAASVARAVEDLDGAIAATQLGITATSIGLGWIGERSIAGLLQPGLAALGVEGSVAVHSIAVVMAFILITFVHVVAGELAPKALALSRPGEVALLLTGPLLLFSRIFHPLLVVMNGAGNALVRMIGVHPSEHDRHIHSPAELSLMVSESTEAGMIRAYTSRILGNVFRTSRCLVKEVMVPRNMIFAVQKDIDPEALLDRIREASCTRIPVYDHTLDEIVGILHTKDLFHLYSQQRVVIMADAIRPAMNMAPDLPILDALRLFRTRRSHMAVVREEDGPVLGIVTLEDVLEEFVGEIEDEHDIPTPAGAE